MGLQRVERKHVDGPREVSSIVYHAISPAFTSQSFTTLLRSCDTSACPAQDTEILRYILPSLLLPSLTVIACDHRRFRYCLSIDTADHRFLRATAFCSPFSFLSSPLSLLGFRRCSFCGGIWILGRGSAYSTRKLEKGFEKAALEGLKETIKAL